MLFRDKFLEITGGVGEKYRVLREEDNMDIVIDDYKSKRVIVIENKIKSCINGKQENDSQLDSYRNKAKKHANNLGFPSDNIKSLSLNRSNLSQNNYACRQLKKRQIG